MTINMADIHEKTLAYEIRIQLQMMKNRDVADDPLKSDELLVSVPREKLKEILGLALETLISRFQADLEYEARP